MNRAITRVFMNGNSQAIRIPADFRLETDRVEISRNDHGDLVIHPLARERQDRGLALLQALEGFDDAFIAALEQDREELAAHG